MGLTAMTTVKKCEYDSALKKFEMDILIGQYKPKERLIESEVMDKYGITRNAVRNIFRELQAKKLIRHIPNRGVQIADIETHDARDLYSMRILLENYATDLVIRNIDVSSLAEITRANQKFIDAIHENNFNDQVTANIDFHKAIINVSANSILIEMVNQLRNRAVVIRHYMWRQQAQREKSIEDHAALIEALRNRDAGTFKKINQVHILAAFEQYTGQKYSDVLEGG